jgi:hypothetical protein
MKAHATTTIDSIDPKKLLKVLSDYERGDFSVRLRVPARHRQDLRHAQ